MSFRKQPAAAWCFCKHLIYTCSAGFFRGARNFFLGEVCLVFKHLTCSLGLEVLENNILLPLRIGEELPLSTTVLEIRVLRGAAEVWGAKLSEAGRIFLFYFIFKYVLKKYSKILRCSMFFCSRHFVLMFFFPFVGPLHGSVVSFFGYF